MSLSPPLNSDPSSLQGFLLKKGDVGIIKSYKKRWFRQVRDKLFYSETQIEDAKGYIDLSNFSLGYFSFAIRFFLYYSGQMSPFPKIQMDILFTSIHPGACIS
jgi:hypothetical protein